MTKFENDLHFVVLLSKQKDLDKSIIHKHVSYLKKLDAEGILVFCGPFTDYDGGMLIIKTENKAAAIEIAEQDPFVKEGYETYEIRTLLQSCEKNNHLGMG